MVLTLADTGEGMPPEVLARAFEPFFTTRPQGKGTGLGLAQVYGTAQQLGGAVTLRSRPGEGTTVSMYLPRAEPTARDGPADGRFETPNSNEAARILVVDDDPQVRAMAVASLEELGDAVDEVLDGSDALRLLRAGSRFDLLLTDYAMPGMTGTELAGRAQAVDPGLGVLLMTGYADAAAVPAGTLPVLRKPFALDDLRSAVERLLAGRPGRVLPFRRAVDDGGGRGG
ncbi:response regulator [Methylobacterium platani]|uniref:response regulator n=1 Tax=Methylobacterium platani TaxID=427683 RepID=UPI0012E1D827|nr:response regulator [Methylobacterium platani]